MNNNPDEFDVELTIKKLYSLLVKALIRLSYPVRILFHKPIKLAIALMVAGVLSYGLNKVLTPVYQSTFSFKPTTANDYFFLNQLNDLHELVKDHDKEQLAAQLKLPIEALKALTYLDTKAIWSSPRKDTILLLLVHLKSQNKADFISIQNALMTYLENSEHYARLKHMRQQQINLLRTKLQDDMSEIDSLKKLMAQSMFPRNAGGFVYGEPLDPVKLYDAGLNLYRQQISLNWQQEYVSSFELTTPCLVSNKPAWPRFSYLLAASGLITCLITGWHNHRNKS